MPGEEQAVDEKSLKAAIRRFIDLEVDEAFLTKHGAHAVSISRRKKRDGSRTPELCLILHVEPGLKPRGEHARPAATPIDRRILFTDPDTGITVEIPTDVVEEGHAKLHGGPWRPSKSSPVAGGMSCTGTPKAGFDHLIGTLGGWVWDLDDNTYVALSNMHIFGDPQGNVYHPDYASRQKSGVFGVVTRVAPEAGDQPPFRADCAIVRAKRPSRAQFQVNVVGPAVMASGDADENDTVEKVGFATNHTRGRVTNPGWSGVIEDPRSGVRRMFRDCLYVVPDEDPVWTQSGDSGALVFARERVGGPGGGSKPVVGLHVAGDDAAGYGIACRIDNVFDKLRLTTLPHGVLVALAREVMGDLPADASAVARAERKIEMDALIKVMVDFLDHCRHTETGVSLVRVLDQGRAELVTILAQNRRIRSRAASLLRRTFFGRGQVGNVLPVVVDKGLLADARALATALQNASKGNLGELVRDLRAALPRAGTTSIGGFLMYDAPDPR